MQLLTATYFWYTFDMKYLIVILLSGIILTACNKTASPSPTPTYTGTVTNFEECKAAGNPINESYPETCKTSDGQHFIADIGNEIELATEIVVENPRPRTKIVTPLEIKGRAKGFWFFEGSMTAELRDSAGKELGKANLEAQEPWMTESFVPFTGTLTYELPENTSGVKLYIEKANPSGLEENDKTLVIPVTL